MADSNDAPRDEHRRAALKSLGAGMVATAVGGAAAADRGAPPARGQAAGGAYNILFILTDQERYFRPGELPEDYRLPAHERLARKGMVFENHRINSCVCTSSRSVLYTGRHIQQTRMFDNTNFPWISSMSTDIKTIGHLLREAGYYTAYKGKWHLTKEFETVNELDAPTKIFTKEMEAYGFSDYIGRRRHHRAHQGGYLHDGMIAATGVSWLRGKRQDLRGGQAMVPRGEPGQPARHDVLQHRPAGRGRRRRRTMLGPDPADPAHALYAKQWDFDLPASLPAAARCARPPGRAHRLHPIARRHGRPHRGGRGHGAGGVGTTFT